MHLTDADVDKLLRVHQQHYHDMLSCHAAANKRLSVDFSW